MRTLGKAMALFLLVTAYLAASSGISILPVNRRIKRARLVKNTSFFARLMLAALGTHVTVIHRERLPGSGKGRLIVSNHLSYIDILVIASLMPSVFITSVELKNTAFLGMMARLGGSLFVERRSPAGLKREISLISRTLGEGFSVVLFPEAATSNGDTVRQFKNSLFSAAIESNAEVLPLCLRYTKMDGKPVGPENRDSIYYYGGMSFTAHILRLLTRKSVEAELVLLKAINLRGRAVRKELATLAHEAIHTAYHSRRA